MEKFVQSLINLGRQIGSAPVMVLIVGSAGLLCLALLAVGVWVMLEVCGLMAVRTGVREGFWVFLLVTANVKFAIKPQSRLFQPATVVRHVIAALYFINAILLLWADKPALFWVLLVGMACHIASIFFPGKPQSSIYLGDHPAK